MTTTTPYDEAVQQFAGDGYTLLREVIPRDFAQQLAGGFVQLAEEAKVTPELSKNFGIHVLDTPAVEEIERRDLGDGGGLYRHVQFETRAVNQAAPHLMGVYFALRPALEALCDETVILSPYERSAVNVKVLLEEGDGQGWHYDTNALTALLYLTSTDQRTGTCIQVGNGDPGEWDEVHVEAQPGDLLVMRGRELWHRIPDHFDGPRVTVPLNYYHPGDTDRPAGLDALVYGDAR